MLNISFVSASTGGNTFVVPCFEGALDTLPVAALQPLLAATEFKGKKGQTEVFQGVTAAPAARIVLLGLGKQEELTVQAVQEAGGSLYARLEMLTDKADLSLKHWPETLSICPVGAAVQLATGAALRAYRFDKYKTRGEDDKGGSKKAKLQTLEITLDKATEAASGFTKDALPLITAVREVRDLQNEPANIIYPVSFAAKAKELLAPLGVKVTVLGEAEMKKLGMNALLGVGQGSAQESQLLILEYLGAPDKKTAPTAIVGKGVCFDTGGISIKPSANMEDMKWDMGGAGVVVGTLYQLAARKASHNVIGICGLVENMPSGTAQRPGDIVTSMSGQTIEVLNTDAEGRLVLADALWYVQEKYQPKQIIDLATLTGAIIVALGEITAGLFSNDDTLANQLFEAGKKTAEPLWRLPMNDDYDKDIDSDFADMKNIGSGRGAGSTTAAQFLQRFIKKGTPWAHLDIAGVTWTKKPTSLCPKGATAFGVRLLDAWFTGQSS